MGEAHRSRRLTVEERFKILKYWASDDRPSLQQVADRYSVHVVTVAEIRDEAARNHCRLITPRRLPGDH